MSKFSGCQWKILSHSPIVNLVSEQECVSECFNSSVGAIVISVLRIHKWSTVGEICGIRNSRS